MSTVSLRWRRFSRPIWVGLLLFSASRAPLVAGDPYYLAAGRPDSVALLPPPPRPDSPEQAADLEEVIAVHKQVNSADKAMGLAEKKFTVFSFTPAIGTFFQPGKFPKTESLFARMQADEERVEESAKNHWKRPRPYTVEPRLADLGPITEKSFSYPSGHSTRATMYALVLSELFPEKQEAIMAIGRAIGWHRVQLARHYPTDIYAGRALAQAIVRELKANPKFLSDLEAAKAELHSASLESQAAVAH